MSATDPFIPPTLPPSLVVLSAPVPPMLEAAVGYPGAARFVALYWTPFGDEAVYDDGAQSGDGSGVAYQGFVHHPAVAHHLTPYELGSSDQEARHWLLLDRRARRLYVGPRTDVAVVVRAQPGRADVQPREALPTEPAAARAALPSTERDEIRVDQTTLADHVRASMAREMRLVDELVGWLEGQAEGGEQHG
jgi:hypothetical protein